MFAQGANSQGGKEYLRLLFSQEAGRFFTEATGSLTAVQGAADGLDLTLATQSVQEAIAAAGANTFIAQYSAWYAALDEEADLQFNLLMTGQATPEEVSSALQALTDELRDDESVPKFTREAPAATEATPAT